MVVVILDHFVHSVALDNLSTVELFPQEI